MDFAREPRWELPPGEAIALQRELAGLVSLADGMERLDLAAGVDLAVGRGPGPGRAAAVVWQPADDRVRESRSAEGPLEIPYIPGLLAFREGPLVERVLRALRCNPDVLLFDGHGIAHPRGLGIASHLGVLLDRPTIGVAKSRLFGTAVEPGPDPGDRTALLAPDGRRIGAVLRTRRGSRPLWISPGHRISLETAVSVVLHCLRGHRLPEPTYLADRLTRIRAGEEVKR